MLQRTTPIQLAEKLNKRKEEEKTKTKKIDELDKIISAFKNIEAGGNLDSLESIKLEFAPIEDEEFNPSNTELLLQIMNQLEEINEKLSKK